MSNTDEIPATESKLTGNVRCRACRIENAAGQQYCRRCARSLIDAIPVGDSPASSPAKPEGVTEGQVASRNELATFGGFLLACGLGGVLVGLLLPTTVETSSYGLDGIGGGAVHNLGLMSRKLYVIVAAGFTAVCGGLMLVAAYVRDTRDELAKQKRVSV